MSWTATYMPVIESVFKQAAALRERDAQRVFECGLSDEYTGPPLAQAEPVRRVATPEERARFEQPPRQGLFQFLAGDLLNSGGMHTYRNLVVGRYRK